MKKLLSMLLALCLCAACFAVFAEEAKKDEQPAEKSEEALDEKLVENFNKFVAYITIHKVLEALDLKDSDLYKAAEKEAAPVYALSKYFLDKGTDVTDPAELAKKDELKDFADFFAGKMDMDPKYVIEILLNFGSLDEDAAEGIVAFGLEDALLKFAYGLEVLGSDIKENDVLKEFKSVLEYAEGLDDEDVKELIATIKSIMDDFLKDDAMKEKFKELADIVSKVAADKLEAVSKEVTDALDAFAKAIGGSDSSDEADEEAKDESKEDASDAA